MDSADCYGVTVRTHTASQVRYFEQLLRSCMLVLEGAQSAMQREGLDESARELRRALIKLEDAWTTLAIRVGAELASRPEPATDADRAPA
jgi:hypothetical protein